MEHGFAIQPGCLAAPLSRGLCDGTGKAWLSQAMLSLTRQSVLSWMASESVTRKLLIDGLDYISQLGRHAGRRVRTMG